MPPRAAVADLAEVFRRHGDAQSGAELDCLAGVAAELEGDVEAARACFQRLVDAGDELRPSPAGQRAAIGLARILAHVDRRYDDALAVIDTVLGVAAEDHLAAAARSERAYCLYQQGLLVNAETEARTAIAAVAAAGDPRLHARALQYLSLILSRQADPESLGAAARHLRQASKLVPDDSQERAEILDSLGRVCSRSGNHIEAVTAFGQSLAIKQGLGDTAGMAITHGGLGDAHLRVGRWQEALRAYERDLELVGGPTTDHPVVCQLYCSSAECYRQGKRFEDGARQLEAGAAAAARLADGAQRRVAEGYLALCRGRLAGDTGDSEAALAHFTEAETAFLAAGRSEPLPAVRRGLGEVHLRRMDLAEARAALDWAAGRETDPWEQLSVFRALAECAALQGRTEDLSLFTARTRFLEQRFHAGTAAAPAAYAIQILESPPRQLGPGEAAAIRLRVRGADGNGCAGVAVELASPSLEATGGSLSPATGLTTDADGVVAATVCTGCRGGHVTVEAHVVTAAVKVELYFLVTSPPPPATATRHG